MLEAAYILKKKEEMHSSRKTFKKKNWENGKLKNMKKGEKTKRGFKRGTPETAEKMGDDLENLAVSSSLQAWFDTEVLGAHVCDNVDAIATTEQRSRTAFRSDVKFEPPEEVPDNSEPITSVDTRKVERKFAVRKRDGIDCRRWSAGRQRSEDAVERCRRIGSGCEISRKDRVAAEKTNVVSESFGTRKVSVRSLATSSCAVFPR